MEHRDVIPRRTAWPFTVAAVLFCTATVLSVLEGEHWLALCQGASTGICGVLALRADERRPHHRAGVWALLGVSVLMLFAVAVG